MKVCLNLLNAAKLNCIWGDLHLGKAEGLNFLTKMCVDSKLLLLLLQIGFLGTSG